MRQRVVIMGKYQRYLDTVMVECSAIEVLLISVGSLMCQAKTGNERVVAKQHCVECFKRNLLLKLSSEAAFCLHLS